MPLKGLVREFKEIKGGIGSISRRNFEVRISNHIRARSQSLAVLDGQNGLVNSEQSRWADLPPELLRDVLERVESSESTWPARRHVVACASVCRTWREIVKELVNNPEESTKLTFPISLKQPGPRDPTVQCFIKRDRATSIYYLYLGLTPTLSVENGKFLLAARKVRRATSTDYILSLSADDLYRGSTTYIGRLRSNFLGTKFIIHDSHPEHSSSMISTSHGGRGIGSSNSSFRVPGNNFNVACISYELNVMGTRGPRRMQCTLYSIPATAMESVENAQTPTEVPSAVVGDSFSSFSFSKPLGPFPVLRTTEIESLTKADSKIKPLILKNKAPRWHEQLQCWCLNFRGRVTVASVKNFQLVAAVEPGQSMGQSDHDNKVLLQFGKIEKDVFTMDYRYPLSAFQAFAICLSSFDTKLACE